jgi:hypothetical protein
MFALFKTACESLRLFAFTDSEGRFFNILKSSLENLSIVDIFRESFLTASNIHFNAK